MDPIIKRFRRKKFAAVVAAFLLALFQGSSAYAWSEFGHMVVGYAAYVQLNEKIQRRVKKLLRLNRTVPWKNNLKAAAKFLRDDDAVFGALAGRWADDWGKYSNEDENPDFGNPEQGYKEHYKHKKWHFVNYYFSQDGTQLPTEIKTPNVEILIDRIRKVLSSSASDSVKSYCLVWLFHLVGDIHQPLHSIARVSKFQDKGDAGGNLVKIDDRTLHDFWDAALGDDGNDFAGAVALAKSLPKPDEKDAEDLDLKTWIEENMVLAKIYVYDAPVDDSPGPYTSNPKYLTDAEQIAKKRISMAAFRLAKILNQELK